MKNKMKTHQITTILTSPRAAHATLRAAILFFILHSSFILINAQPRTESEAYEIATQFIKGRKTEDGGRKTEDGGRRTEDGGVTSSGTNLQVLQSSLHPLLFNGLYTPFGSPVIGGQKPPFLGGEQPLGKDLGWAATSSFYIFSDSVNPSFVIVARDARQGDILGWSDTSPFPTTDLPEGLVDLLTLYDAAASVLCPPSSVLSSSSSVLRPQSSVLSPSSPVPPLLRTRWGQGSPYNLHCPTIRGVRTVTGCVATAMAQILNYYGAPTRGRGICSYTDTISGDLRAFDYGSTTFDWAHMRDTYSGYYTDEEAAAVADLMYACGVGVHMDYGTGSSGAYSEDVGYALREFFGYNTHVGWHSRDAYDDATWYALLDEELAAGRPVLYTGVRQMGDDLAGHAFVIDGTDGDHHYHVNWGWSGSADGYFALGNLTPYRSQTYDLYQEAITLITPDEVGTPRDYFYADDFAFEVIKGQRTEDRGQRTEDRGRKTEDGGRKTEGTQTRENEVSGQKVLPLREDLGGSSDTLRLDVHGVSCVDNRVSTLYPDLTITAVVGVVLCDSLQQPIGWFSLPDTIDTNLYYGYDLWYTEPLTSLPSEPGLWWLRPAAQSLTWPAVTPMRTNGALTDAIPVFVDTDGTPYVGYTEVPTAIIPIHPDTDNPDDPFSVLCPPSSILHTPLYDLQGRPVTNPQPHHLYIQSGRKVMIK